MQDYFLRDRLNTLTGLTSYSQVTNQSISNVTPSTWSTIYTRVNTTNHIILTSFKFTLSNTVNTLYGGFICNDFISIYLLPFTLYTYP